MNAAIKKGRELAAWVKDGPHRQGDGYAAGVYFFTTPKEHEIVQEGLALVRWSFEQALNNGGCGRHVVPAEPVARAQVKALERHGRLLPTVLREFAIVMRSTSLTKHSEEVRQLAELALNQLFERHLLYQNADQGTMGGNPKNDTDKDHERARQLMENLRDARALTDYFCLSLATLARSLAMSEQS